MAVCLSLLITAIAGCAAKNSFPQNGKINVVTTIFAQYDFVRQIAGDRANIVMMLPIGTEAHVFEPSPSDIVMVNKADVFIYTGEMMENWAHKMLESLSNKNIAIVDTSQNVLLYKTEDIEKEHQHQDGEDVEDGKHETKEHIDSIYDPHFWTSPINAKIIVDTIANALCDADPTNASYYTANAQNYKSELDKLDLQFKEIVQNGKRKEIIFGGRFAFYYFTKQYGLQYHSAYDSCSTESEPSLKTVAELINNIEQDNLPVIYYEEITQPRVAYSIAGQTGAAPLLMHSCHNVTQAEFDGGATYLSLMRQNAENLKAGLN